MFVCGFHQPTFEPTLLVHYSISLAFQARMKLLEIAYRFELLLHCSNIYCYLVKYDLLLEGPSLDQLLGVLRQYLCLVARIQLYPL